MPVHIFMPKTAEMTTIGDKMAFSHENKCQNDTYGLPGPIS